MTYLPLTTEDPTDLPGSALICPLAIGDVATFEPGDLVPLWLARVENAWQPHFRSAVSVERCGDDEFDLTGTEGAQMPFDVYAKNGGLPVTLLVVALRGVTVEAERME